MFWVIMVEALSMDESADDRTAEVMAAKPRMDTVFGVM